MFQGFAPRAFALLTAVLLTACGGGAPVDATTNPTLFAAVQASEPTPPTAAERAAQEAYLLAYEQAQSIELNRQTRESQARARMLAYEDAAAQAAASACAGQEAAACGTQDTAVN
jgi:hypothetical protein